ncbi:hypothetical protein [Gimesia sp.]|nr:hypothetical protein [Gimesia sp.]
MSELERYLDRNGPHAPECIRLSGTARLFQIERPRVPELAHLLA